MLRIGSIAGFTLTATLVLAAGVVQGDVVIDMPPPVTAEATADAATAAAPATIKASEGTAEQATEVAAGNATPTTTKVPKTPLARFGDRQQAQDSAGNTRGVNISSTFSSGSMTPGGMGWGGSNWGYGGFDDDWGWSGYWGVSPWLLMSGYGWGGGCCPPYGSGWGGSSWGGGCTPYGGGYAFGWSGSSISIGGSSGFLRIGNVGLIR